MIVDVQGWPMPGHGVGVQCSLARDGSLLELFMHKEMWQKIKRNLIMAMKT